jgi:hypothetical protein
VASAEPERASCHELALDNNIDEFEGKFEELEAHATHIKAAHEVLEALNNHKLSCLSAVKASDVACKTLQQNARGVEPRTEEQWTTERRSQAIEVKRASLQHRLETEKEAIRANNERQNKAVAKQMAQVSNMTNQSTVLLDEASGSIESEDRLVALDQEDELSASLSADDTDVLEMIQVNLETDPVAIAQGLLEKSKRAAAEKAQKLKTQQQLRRDLAEQQKREEANKPKPVWHQLTQMATNTSQVVSRLGIEGAAKTCKESLALAMKALANTTEMSHA